MKKDTKSSNDFAISIKDSKGNRRTVAVRSDWQLPRILYLKMLYGDDYMDYIKDDVGVENFLNDSFKKRDEKLAFLKNNKSVIEFITGWLVLTDFYKERFGKNVRDKDAMNLLSSEFNFKTITKLYDFRCELFKADFSLDDKFDSKLNKYLLQLKRINKILQNKKNLRNRNLIKNKVW